MYSILEDYFRTLGFRQVNVNRILKHYKSHGVNKELVDELVINWLLNKLTETNIKESVDADFLERLMHRAHKVKEGQDILNALRGSIIKADEIKASRARLEEIERGLSKPDDEGVPVGLGRSCDSAFFEESVQPLIDDLEAAIEKMVASLNDRIVTGSWITTPEGVFQVYKVGGKAPDRIYLTEGSAFKEADIKLWKPSVGEIAVFMSDGRAVIAKCEKYDPSSGLYLAGGICWNYCEPFVTIEDFINIVTN